jgi:uncharacterized protein (DUF58 family)
MIRLTKTGVLFLGVLALFYFASLTSQSGLLLLPIGILLACYLINFSGAIRSLRQLEVHPPPSIHVQEGERVSQPWRITNRGHQPSGLIEAESKAGSLFRLATIGGKDTANLVPELTYQRRGVYEYGKIRLTSIFPFGLIKTARRMELPGEVVVCPAVYETHAPHASGYDVMVGGKLKGNRRTTSGSHFAGVRPHQPGDPLKHIHWKSSSKGQGLMVKTFDEELSGRISIVMDTGRAGAEDTLDDCVRAAGSLIFAALDAGHHVEWIDLARMELMLIPPFADGHEILDTLARVKADKPTLTEEKLSQALGNISHKSAISLVLTDFTPAVWPALEQLLTHHRNVSLYMPSTPPCRQISPVWPSTPTPRSASPSSHEEPAPPAHFARLHLPGAVVG